VVLRNRAQQIDIYLLTYYNNVAWWCNCQTVGLVINRS